MSVSVSTRVALAAIFGTLAVLALGVGGFALGRSDRTSKAAARDAEQSARAQAFTASDSAAYHAAWSRGYAAGLKRGELHGRQAGATTGRRKGKVVADQRAASASGGCPSGLVPEGTEACVEPGGQSAGCGGDPYSTPTRSGGCIGPAHPPTSAATPASCPAGQVPVGETGACAPPEGTNEESTPSVNSPEGQRALESPECQGEPAPPSGYEGPVQC